MFFELTEPCFGDAFNIGTGFNFNVWGFVLEQVINNAGQFVGCGSDGTSGSETSFHSPVKVT